jgi:hypothetical protein
MVKSASVMERIIMRLLIVLLLSSVTAFTQQQKRAQVDFPTKEEINLVVTQAERAFEQYKTSVAMEANLQSAKEEPSALQKDQRSSGDVAQAD